METNKRKNSVEYLAGSRMPVTPALFEALRAHFLSRNVRPTDIDDAIQAALAKLQKKHIEGSFAFDSDSPIERVFAYLRQTVKNKRIDQQRKVSRDRRVERKYAGSDFDMRSPAEEALKRDQAEHVKKVVAKRIKELPAKQAWLLDQFYYKNQTIPDIARRLGQTPQNVGKQLKKVFDVLRVDLK